MVFPVPDVPSDQRGAGQSCRRLKDVANPSKRPWEASSPVWDEAKPWETWPDESTVVEEKKSSLKSFCVSGLNI